MRHRSQAILPLAALAFTATSPAAVDFEKDIRPILEIHCVKCHGAGKDKGGLRLHTEKGMLAGGESGEAVLIGNPEKSGIYTRLLLSDEDEAFMPRNGKQLPKPQTEALRAWIAEGAPWPEDARLSAPEMDADETDPFPLLTKAGTASSVPSETARRIDTLIAAENAASPRKDTPKNIPATKPVDDLAFLRRASIDLIGRIPSKEEIDAFRTETSSAPRAALVERLLEDPRFIGRWSIFFADMLRVRTNLDGGDKLLAMLRQSLAEHTPYDELARQLIAANGKPGADPAVGFVLGDNADPMALAGATSQVFLGVQLACAQCHDHPFDDWKQKDFYELAAFFGKTRRVESRFARSVYTTEAHEMAVLWPPAEVTTDTRTPMKPAFPFELVSFKTKPDYIARLEERRAKSSEQAKPEAAKELLDSLLDQAPVAKKNTVGDIPDILAEAREASADLKVEKDLYKPSELRARLAELVTDPRNPYFARSFVNRVWAELVGRGIVDPVDNFSPYNPPSHPETLEFLAREFIASGYDFRALVRLIVLTDTYQLAHPPGDTPEIERLAAERAFTAAPVRRMVSEVLYDSIVTAGHLEARKWPDGANLRTVTRQIRVPLENDTAMAPAAAPTGDEPQMAMMDAGAMPKQRAPSGYDLEKTIALDFDAILKRNDADTNEIEEMRAQSDEELEAERLAKMRADAMAANRSERYTLETIEEKIDDNPQFDSALTIASPAPPAHFLRVFGQPSRDGLGEFRDHSPSLRQELMMLNGRLTHEAARVGTLEPLHKLLSSNLNEAISHTYLEILTRTPNPTELTEAKEIIATSPTPHEGMADLRWILLNTHEFRYLP